MNAKQSRNKPKLDITERKRAEEALQAQNEFITNLFESLTYPFIVINSNDHTIALANAAAKALAAKDLSTCYALTHRRKQPCDGVDHPCPLEMIKKSKRPVVVEHQHYDQDGNERIVEVHGYPILDRDDHVIQMIEYTHDITELKVKEARLSRETERTKLLLELYLKAPQLTDKELYDYVLEKTVSLTESTIGFFHQVADDQKTIILTAWNNEALKNCDAAYDTRYSIDDAGNWVDCVRLKEPVVYNDFPNSPSQKGLPEGHTPLRRFMSIPVMEGEKVRFIFGVGNKPVDYDEHDVAQLQLVANELHKIVMHRQAEEALQEVRDELEERVGERTAELDERVHEAEKLNRAMVNLMEDLQAANRRLERTGRELESANKDLEAFSYSVSHDLRAPLRAIDGFGGAIMEDYSDKLDSEGQRLLRVIRKNTRQMGQLIDDLLAFSRTGRQTMGSTKLDMSVIAKTVYEELNSLTSERKLRFEIKRLPPAYGDWSMIHQVWMNLLSNAVKFTRPVDTPVIEVGGTSEENENIYYVKDNGAGFDMKYVDKLFGVFQRLHSASDFEGTGVGLALVQRIIDRHGGRVWAEGQVNEGAAFYFTLPKNEGDLQ